MTSSKDMDALKHKRTYLRAKVTRKHNTIVESVEEYNTLDCNEQIDILKLLSKQLYDFDDEIGAIISSLMIAEELDSEIQNAEEYEQKVTYTLRILKERLAVLTPNNPIQPDMHSGITTDDHSHRGTKLKLPEIPLPKFDNKDDQCLIQFFLNFEGVINKYNLSEYEKFIYLEKQLGNEPLTLIKSLTGSKRSYNDAKDILNQAFARPIKQKYNCVKRLENLKFDLTNPYKYVTEVKLLISSFNDLEMDLYTVIQYFVWAALPMKYQTQLLHITNSSYPSLEDIQENIFEAIERVKGENKSHEFSSSTFAANIGSKRESERSSGKGERSSDNGERSSGHKFKPCCLCSKDHADHPIFKCQKYATAKSKIDRLRELNLCIKCGFSGHDTKDCRFKFYKSCVNCDKTNHFSYLCFKEKSSPILNNSVCTYQYEVLSARCLKGNILPTFSAKLPNDSIIRVLKDSGAETSFIRESIANSCDFQTLESDVNLTIRGINSKRTVKTKLVNVSMSVGNLKCIIPAVCIPELTTAPSQNGAIKVANCLLRKNYKIADDFIINNPDKSLDMILGVECG